jgi:hypothetical protein
MTADEKRARRKAKHQALNLVGEGLSSFRRLGGMLTGPQVRRAAKVVVEKHLASIRRGEA